jgi:integral membrane protein (TIGR01906 family)
MNKLWGGAGRVALALAVFLVLPTTGVLVFMSPWFVAHEYGQAGFPAAERYEPAERLALAQETVRHIVSPGGEQGLRAMQSGGEPVYNEREVQHLVDVIVVLDALRWVWRAAGVALLAALGLALVRPAWRRPVARSVFWGSAALLATLGAILVTAALSFDFFFVNFHQVFFKPGTWMFNYSDSLIQFYPVEFWMDAVWKLGALVVAMALVVGGLALACLRRTGAAR